MDIEFDCGAEARHHNNVADEDILWRGRQWCVSHFGLETISEPYHYAIDKCALGNLHEPRGVAWLEHVSEKTWLDFDDFLQSFQRALEIHRGAYRPIPEDQMQESIGHFYRAKALMAEEA